MFNGLIWASCLDGIGSFCMYMHCGYVYTIPTQNTDIMCIWCMVMYWYNMEQAQPYDITVQVVPHTCSFIQSWALALQMSTHWYPTCSQNGISACPSIVFLICFFFIPVSRNYMGFSDIVPQWDFFYKYRKHVFKMDVGLTQVTTYMCGYSTTYMCMCECSSWIASFSLHHIISLTKTSPALYAGCI